MSERSDNWQVFTELMSAAFWNTAKVFHFIGRVSGRISEELAYRDDFPFGRSALDYTPEDVNIQIDNEYDTNSETEKDDDQQMTYWFQTDKEE